MIIKMLFISAIVIGIAVGVVMWLDRNTLCPPNFIDFKPSSPPDFKELDDHLETCPVCDLKDSVHGPVYLEGCPEFQRLWDEANYHGSWKWGIGKWERVK